MRNAYKERGVCCCAVLIALVSILLFPISSQAALEMIYDFTLPGASILNGQTTGTFIVDGIPLQVQAGLMTQDGDFDLGGANSALLIGASGLGMTSDLAGGSQIQADTSIATIHDGVVLMFSPLFIPQSMTLSSFFNGEDLRLLVGDDLTPALDLLSTSETGDVTLDLSAFGGFSTWGITSLGLESPEASSDDSDYFVA
jgi:hypothetical protein